MTREEAMMNLLLERAKTLLKATKELLEKQENSSYVINVLKQTIVYDGVEYDGVCLKDDIDYWFDELGEQEKLNHTLKR